MLLLILALNMGRAGSAGMRENVGVLRIERRTSVLSGQRSNRLSYTPKMSRQLF
jgi:hypothetical protein